MSRAAARVYLVAIGIGLAVLAVEIAVLECFLLPSYLGSTPVPLSILAAGLGNLLLPALAYRVSGSRVVGILPVLAWLAVVVVASLPRPEGDLIVTGGLRGLIFLLVGALAGAYAVGRIVARPPSGPGGPVRSVRSGTDTGGG